MAKWGSGAALHGKAVFPPMNADALLLYEPHENQLVGLDVKHLCVGDEKWSGGVAAGGKAIFAPQSATSFLVYDEVAHCATLLDVAEFRDSLGCGWNTGVAVGSKAVFAPLGARHVLVYDVDAEELSSHDVSRLPRAGETWQWQGGVALGSKAIFAPSHASSAGILLYDAEEDDISLMSIVACGFFGTWTEGFAMGTQAVFAPADAGEILIYDAEERSIEGVEVTAHTNCFGKFRGGVGLCGRAVFAPWNGENLLVLEVASGQLWAHSTRQYGAGTEQWCGGVSVGSTAVFAPWNAHHFLVYDAEKDMVLGVDVQERCQKPRKWSRGLALGSCLVFAPYDAKHVVTFGRGNAETRDAGHATAQCPLVLSQAPHPDRLVELAAAVLSNWVYDAEPKYTEDDPVTPPIPSMTVSGAAFQYSVHRVWGNEALKNQGVLSTVTVAIPAVGKVLFVVFKGTSYLLDLIKWDVGRSYEATGTKDTFVHMGAASLIRELAFLKSDDFLARMEVAADQGVLQLVFCGHSLGGIYAAAVLQRLFMERRTRVTPRVKMLLESMRCITFGAPMAFGRDLDASPSEAFDVFSAFMRQRAVNFIHENDPCPRAWSELDIANFVRQAAAGLKDGIHESKGGLAGRMAGKAIDALVEGLIDRPDFEQLVQSVKGFRQMPRVCLLSRLNRSRWHWVQDFHLDKHSLHDHSMTEYLTALCDASDPARPCCLLYLDDGSPAVKAPGSFME